ncbi:MAG: nucleotidyltransferase family protein [Flavobacteriaceae bacterium]
MSKTAILILAAGESKRLGKPKQLLPYKEETLLTFVIKQVKPIKNTEVFVIIGAHFSEVFQSIRHQKVTIIKNADWQKGMGSSISKGIGFIKNKNSFDRVLVTLTDLPLIKTDDYENLIASSISSGKRILLTDYENISGVPVVFDKSLFNELSLLNDDEGAKPVIKKYKKEVLKVTSKTPFFDIDTAEAYQKLLNLE